MLGSLGRWRSAYRLGFALAIAGGCATYVNEPPTRGNSVAGAAGADDEPVAGKGGSAGATGSGGGGTSGAGGTMAGAGGTKADAGDGGGGTGGANGGAGGGGSGGQGGAGGVSGAGGNPGGGSGGRGGGGAGGMSGGASGAGSGGKSTGGAGGATMTVTCAKNPIPSPSGWTVTASHSRPNNLDPVGNIRDGELDTRWSSGKDQAGDEWLQVDFGASVKLTRVTLALGANPDDYPRQFAARFSVSSQNLAAPVLDSGAGAEGEDTVIDLPGTVGRYLLITQGGMATALWWSVAELEVECED